MKATCGHPQDWHQCYAGSHDLWVGEAYSHPAKMSPALCSRILSHLKELGLLSPEDTILDFLCGIGTTVILGALQGNPAIGVELEPKFVDLAQQNIAHVSKKVGRELPATIIQGDARHLSELLRERGMIGITSPPYQDSAVSSDGQRGIDSGDVATRRKAKRRASPDGYPTTPGQIGRLKDGPMKGIVSPPYQNIEIGKGLNTKPPRAGSKDQAGRSPQAPSQTETTYSDNPDNIANLPDRVVGVTSPPYESTTLHGIDTNPERMMGGPPAKSSHGGGQVIYHNPISEGQIGQERAESYLSAMCQVYAEAFKVCDVLAVVTKNPTRNGALRRLDLDTIALLEEVGFTIRCVHRAILFQEHQQGVLVEEAESQWADWGRAVEATQGLVPGIGCQCIRTPTKEEYMKNWGDKWPDNILKADTPYWVPMVVGGLVETDGNIVKGRLSFFKRLSYQKGSPVAQWEDVIVAVRDGGGLKGITSPPYEETASPKTGIDLTKSHWPKAGGQANNSQPFEYGQTPGQIGNLK